MHGGLTDATTDAPSMSWRKADFVGANTVSIQFVGLFVAHTGSNVYRTPPIEELQLAC